MARMKFLFLSILGLTACSPSPLYVDRAQVGTYGEVPRDGRGEPVWSAIQPVPVVPASEPMPLPRPIGPG
ncbi:hypothetical protein [Polymorphobacter fuscus]|uniref:Uncharacterized protein n=1 Tax=Sandarakinorhabdus fusca TaxID=1439888 RepID=A0A7C9KXQ7_9SPHN|nr:hypothetical protein [Polymorphobacter fuscus]KAB7648482.1 hypothetical protein F9290_01855 [Polymorphobacter fuscus]MQT16008.1 hypothetical protein [Polymorphobacter fuscus]NJC07715.1 hypothetical protein [Polymorphobacter fuscus]